MKRLALTFVLTLLCTALPGQKMTRAEYIARYSALAVEQMEQTGIPASITLAQGCLESGDGNSYLAKEANNHFGIKCHGWKGRSVRHDDDARNECFRSYASAEESYRDHSDFLRYNDRYSTLFNLEPADYRGWAYGLQKAGYATAGDYAERLIGIIEKNSLFTYDIIDDALLPPTPMEAEFSLKLKPLSGTKLYTISLSREILQTNGTAYIIAEKDDTFRSLAREFDLFTSEIRRFNDAGRSHVIQPGEKIYIEAKKRESARHLDKHVMQGGETLREISQRYAVKLKYIYKYNNFNRTGEPEPGTLVNLRNKK